MEDIITLVIIFAAGFYVGWKLQEKLMFITMAEMFRKAGITNTELDRFIGHWSNEEGMVNPSKDDEGYEIVNIKIERHGEALYAFRKDNDQFIGQGDSKESLIARLGEKAVGLRLVIEEGDGADLIGGNFDVDKDGNISQTK